MELSSSAHPIHFHRRAIFRDGVPPGTTLALSKNDAAFIESVIAQVSRVLLETSIIVAVVIWLFLGSMRSALIPSITIPISLLGALGAMTLFGFSINTITLFALILAIGLVVDDAIGVLENIERHIREGGDR